MRDAFENVRRGLADKFQIKRIFTCYTFENAKMVPTKNMEAFGVVLFLMKEPC